MRNNPNVKTLVILTNGPVDKPLKVYDGYDARSEIENSMFREAKQAWFIQRAPKNTKAGFYGRDAKQPCQMYTYAISY